MNWNKAVEKGEQELSTAVEIAVRAIVQILKDNYVDPEVIAKVEALLG